jgi:hypothetical protein
VLLQRLQQSAHLVNKHYIHCRYSQHCCSYCNNYSVTVTPVTRTFKTILCGQQALAEAVAEEPHIVIGNVTDKLMRFRPMGWYGVLGFARYREEALYRIETGSSIAAL